MINDPTGILDPEVIGKTEGKRPEELNYDILEAKLNRHTGSLTVSVRLNFTVPKYLQMQMKQVLLDKIEGVDNLDFEWILEHGKPLAKPEGSSSNKNTESSCPSEKSPIVKGRAIKGTPMSFADALVLTDTDEEVIVDGDLFSMEGKEICYKDRKGEKKNAVILMMEISDHNRAMGVKSFMDPEKYEELTENLSVGNRIRVSGKINSDRFEHEALIDARNINIIPNISKKESYTGEKKRVELHVHTRMSDNDGFNEVDKLVEQAAAWGQPAVAITDHGVVQAFPDAANTAKKLDGKGKHIKVIYGMEGYLYPDEDAWDEDGNIDIKKHRTYHIILLARNKTGLKNLYKLVSYSHIDYFYKKPRLPRSILSKYREGLIIGSACEAGEIYKAVENGVTDQELDELASFYDYLEIQPLGNNQFMIDQGMVSSRDDLINNNLKIVECADRLGKLTVATTDSHYPTKEAAVNRNIIMAGIGFKDTNSDSLYLRTTGEMLDEFSYLGDRAEEIVIENTNKIADMCEEFQPVPAEKYPPHIDGAEETLRNTCYENATRIYGDPLPDEIKNRLETELSSIIGNGYAVMYVAAQMLVKKSNSDGYLVGSRGSVGSSFAATMAGITEVNPLKPHYICPECKYLEFTDNLEKYDVGFDMPDKKCPHCGHQLDKNGLNIPFATFLGFKGNKEPDIDLNFAGEYQPVAHKYVGVIFGEKNVYKAGTVATVAEKTAYGYVMHYAEDKGIHLSKYDTDWLVKGCSGVKRTTGQHPGGIIVVPDDHEIYEFCPIQKPANKDVDIITTHFDYHKIDKNLLKLDILGHDVPQMIKHLQDMTGVDPLKIKLDDPATISIFTSLDALNIKNPDYRFTHGTFAIPEFGTNFTRAMLDDVKPTTISALIKISGFSHGTDVWTNNAQDIIRKNIAGIDEVISCRDDIMNYLINKGLDNSDAFRIMEDVRKNRVLKEDELELMYSHGVPEWYVESCRTLKYLFPRAHAAAYVMMAIRMAWFKVHYPAAFYCAYFSTKTDHFDVKAAREGIEAVEREMNSLYSVGPKATAKQKADLTVYEVMYEMLSRDVQFSMPQLGVSRPSRFYVEDGKVNVPFGAVSGVGQAAAQSLYDAYNENPFSTMDDVRSRTSLSQTNIDDLKELGMFADLPESAQVSIFDLFG